MMDRTKAAQYFIVAWVKDWSLWTYLKVCADGGPLIPFEQAHALYPWLPHLRGFYRRQYVRTYLAETNRPLSDALWDAADDRARLALAPRVEAAVYTGGSRGYFTEARRAAFAGDRELMAVEVLRHADIDHRRRSEGAHWKVCK